MEGQPAAGCPLVGVPARSRLSVTQPAAITPFHARQGRGVTVPDDKEARKVARDSPNPSPDVIPPDDVGASTGDGCFLPEPCPG